VNAGTRLACCARLPTAVTVLLALAMSMAQAQQVFEAGSDYQGSVQGIAFDRSGDAWMATRQTLYRVQGGRVQAVAAARSRGTQLALAPGGRFYAWLVPDNVPGGLFTVQLVEIPDKPIAEIRLPDYPYGFGALYLGGAGQLIVTVTPLDNREGIGSAFQYFFWSSKGRLLSSVALPGRRVGVVDAGGTALLLLGESDAIAFDKDGKQLWKLDGSFRKAALAANGTIALLNPSQENAISEVHVYRNDTLTRVAMSSPVHDLALTADGSDGAVAIDRGQLAFLTPRSCEQRQCSLRPVSPLPVAGTFYISEMRFVDAKTLAVGVIQRTGASPPYTYPAGGILVVTDAGRVAFNSPVTLVQPSPGRPLIDVTYGVRAFAARTPHRALFVDLAP
jgi:hypothetical protein